MTHAPIVRILKYLPASTASSGSGIMAVRICSENSQMMITGTVIHIRKQIILCKCRPMRVLFPDPYACAHSVSNDVLNPKHCISYHSHNFFSVCTTQLAIP